jgi:predicted nucleic acid-binding protein
MKTSIKIYVDANVLIHYCTKVQGVVEALNYVFRQREKEKLFTSSLAIAQTIATLQSNRGERKAFSKKNTIDLVQPLINKMTIIDLTYSDIQKAMSIENKDIEDNIHYILSKKMKCDAIITRNTKDFPFIDVCILKPERRAISTAIH